MNKYKCEVLDDNKIRLLSRGKLLNMKNVLSVIAVIMLAFVLIVAFNNNVLEQEEYVLREQEVRKALIIMAPFTIMEIIFIIVFYSKIKRFIKVITGNYKCVLTSVVEKKIITTEQYGDDGSVSSFPSYYVNLNGIQKYVEVSQDEYKLLQENDQCYAIAANNNSNKEIKAKDIVLVIKATNYNGKNQIIKMTE